MIFGLDTLRSVIAQPEDRGADLDAWLEAKRAGLGGSEVAAVFREHDRMSEMDVWVDKRPDLAAPAQLEALRKRQSEDNQRSRMGRRLEPFVAELYAKGGEDWPRAGGELVAFKPPTVQRTDRPWQLLSPDRVLYEPERARSLGVIRLENAGLTSVIPEAAMLFRPDRGVEIKTHGFAVGRFLPDEDEDADEAEIALPGKLRCQALWCASALEMPTWDVAALIDTHLARTWLVHAVPEISDPMLEESERWWKHHVIDGHRPDPDGTESFSKHLRLLYKKHDHVTMPRRADIDEIAKQLKVLTIARKRAELDAKVLAQRIQDAIGCHLGIETAVGTVTWSENERGSPQYKAAFAELADRAGMTDAERDEIIDRHRGEAPRVFRLPSWTRGMK